MARICIIDDRVDVRETLERKINIYLRKYSISWEVISEDPFKNMHDYIGFIYDNDISVLILDERLHEVCITQEGNSVDYNGSQLVVFLRGYLKDFPIYSITSYSEDENLENQSSLFEEIIAREVFYSKSEKYIPRIIRSGQRFSEAHDRCLLRLSELSELIANGKANEDEIKELKILQESLNIPYTEYDYPSNEAWLKSYEDSISELSDFNNEIEEFLKKIKDVEKNS